MVKIPMRSAFNYIYVLTLLPSAYASVVMLAQCLVFFELLFFISWRLRLNWLISIR